MAIALDLLVSAYQGLLVDRRNLLKKLYLQEFVLQSRNLRFNVQWEFGRVRQISRNAQKALRKAFNARSTRPLASSKDMRKALISESALALERSVYWFLNYRHNLRTDFRDAARQARYYSEFFAMVALTRFLGLAVTYVPKIAKVLTVVDWVQSCVKPEAKLLGGGGHAEQYKLVKKQLCKYGFISSDMRKRFEDMDELLLKEDRETVVYDLGGDALVFRHMGVYTSCPSSCFLGGLNGQGVQRCYSENHEAGVRHEIEIGTDYEEYGIPEENIGVIQREVIGLFQRVGDNTRRFLDVLRTDVKRVSHIPGHEKVDLLEWLS